MLYWKLHAFALHTPLGRTPVKLLNAADITMSCEPMLAKLFGTVPVKVFKSRVSPTRDFIAMLEGRVPVNLLLSKYRSLAPILPMLLGRVPCNRLPDKMRLDKLKLATEAGSVPRILNTVRKLAIQFLHRN